MATGGAKFAKGRQWSLKKSASTGDFFGNISWRKLSEKYTVVCVGYFGVGFSSETAKPRTCENYVEETRAALGPAFPPS